MLDDDYSDVVSAALPAKPRQPRPVSDRLYEAATRAKIDPSVADDFAKVINLESGSSHYDRRGRVKLSAPDPRTGERAVGLTQIKPSTARPYNLNVNDEDQNLEAGLRYFSEGGQDPVARRLHYFGGPKASQHYQRTGRIPKGGDVTGTSFDQYVRGTGATHQQDPYDDVIKAAIPQKAKQQTQSADPYDDVVNAAISGQTPTATEASVTPLSTPAGNRRQPSRQPSVPIEQALQGVADKLNADIARRTRAIPKQPRQAQAPFIDRTIPNMQEMLTKPDTSPQGQEREAIRKQVVEDRAGRVGAYGAPTTKGIAALAADPVGTLTGLLKPEDENISEETTSRLEAAQRSRTPEMEQIRKEYGAMSAPRRAITQPLVRAGAGLLRIGGNELLNQIGMSGEDFSRWANARAQVAEEGAQLAPLDAQGNEIHKGVPEKLAQAAADLGLGIAEIVAMRKATGLPLAQLLALESAAKSSDQPLDKRIGRAGEAYLMGRALDAHLGRGASAVAFGAPTAVQMGAQVVRGEMSPLDALLQTGVQAGAGAVLGGKKTEAPKGETLTQVPDIEGTLAAREARVSSPKEVNIPERPETIAAQLDAVQQGTRPAVLLTKGERGVPVPKGLTAVRTSEGTFYYDPKQVSRETINAKVEDGTYGELLGHVEPKSEATTEAVVARDAQGNEIQSSAVSPENVDRQAEVMKAQYPEANVETGNEDLAKQVIQERVAPPQAQSRTIATEEAAKPTTPTEVVKPTTEQQPNKPTVTIKTTRGDVELDVSDTMAAADRLAAMKADIPEKEYHRIGKILSVLNRPERAAEFPEVAEGVARLRAAKPTTPTPEAAIEPKRENDVFTFPTASPRRTITVFKNPTGSDVREMDKRFREEYPNAPKGEPTTRFTKDAEGNTYRWMSGEGQHTLVEPLIQEKWGQAVNKNMEPRSTTPTPTETAVEAKPTTPQAATPELQRHADAAAELRARSTENLTGIEKAALERKAKRLDAKARGEQLRRAGQDPYELIDDIIIHGGELIRAGKVKFDEWAKGIKDEFGKEADPHLKDVYAQLTGERGPTSIKNEATAELRHELDLTEMERPEKKSWETAIDNAEAKGLMDKTDEIADRIIKGNREEGLDYDESAALLVKTRELENKWEDTYRNNPNDPALNDIKAELDKVSKAVDMGGTDIARALGIRRAMMDKSFKLISLIRQAEKAKGRRVTADEVQRYDAIVKERDAAITARDEALAKADGKASEVSTEKFIREQKLKVRQQGRQRKQSELLTERAEIKQQIAQAWAKTKPKSITLSMGGLGDLDPKAVAEMTRLLTQLARNHIESGVVKAVDLADAVHNEVKDVTDLSKREVSDLISGYGRIRKSTNDPIERKLNEIKSILAATSGKADVLEQATRPLRRGQQREKPTEDQRRALRELNEVMRERGPELGRRPQNVATEQATPLDKAKTTVRNRIEQLNTWLREGKREVEGRSQIIPDAELTRLRSEQSGLERAARLLDDPAADAKAVEKRIGELDKSIAETQAKVRSGDTSTKTAEGMSRWSKEIGEKQRELEVLKRIASDMRVEEARKAREAAKANEPAEPFHGAEMSMSDFDKEAKRSLARVKVLEKQRAEWERKLLAREFGEQAKKRTPPTYNAEVRRAEIRAQNVEAKFTKEMERAKGGHQIRNISGMMKASLLGPSTMVKNFVGTAGWQGFEEQGRVFASLMDNAISLGRQAAGKDAQRGIMGLSPSAVWEATKYGARVGGRQALDILKHGATVEQMERHQYNEIDFGRTGNKAFDTGLKGMEVGFNSVFRILSASDRIFYQGAHRRNLIDRAQVIAKNEGLRGREAQQRARELVAAADAIPEKNAKGERTSELVARLDADAKHDALVSTFNNDNTLSSKIRQFRAKVRNPRNAMSEKAADRVNALENLGMDFLVPFDRTPTNVVSRIVEASPLGYTKNVGQLVKAALNKGMDAEAQRNFSRTFGRASAGTVNMALGAALYGKLITIDDHDQAWLDLGFTKINLNTISPLGNIIGFGARMRKAYEKGDKATSGDYLKPALKEATNIPILRATQPIAEAAQQPDRSIPKTAARFVSMGIPFSGALRDIAKLTDKEDYRKPKGFTDTLKMGIPGLRQQVPVDADRKATVDPLIQKFRSGRLGESDLQTAVDKGTITEAEAKRIKHEGGMSVQEADFSKKKPQDALDTYQRLSPSQRERVREIMERKAWSLLYSDSMTGTAAEKERTRAKLQRQFDRLGLEPKASSSIRGGVRGAIQSAFA